MKYQIKTPNPKYKGTTLGVEFENGLGVTEDKTVRDTLVNEYGYEEVKGKKSVQSTDKE